MSNNDEKGDGEGEGEIEGKAWGGRGAEGKEESKGDDNFQE